MSKVQHVLHLHTAPTQKERTGKMPVRLGDGMHKHRAAQTRLPGPMGGGQICLQSECGMLVYSTTSYHSFISAW